MCYNYPIHLIFGILIPITTKYNVRRKRLILNVLMFISELRRYECYHPYFVNDLPTISEYRTYSIYHLMCWSVCTALFQIFIRNMPFLSFYQR